MQKYNISNIIEFANCRIRIKFKTINYPCDVAGFIVYVLNNSIMLRLMDEDSSNGKKIAIKYEKIDYIEKIESFEHYIRNSEAYFRNGEYQKAFDAVNILLEYDLFKLPEQLNVIDKMIKKCKEKLYMAAKNEPKELNEAILEDDVMGLREGLEEIGDKS